MSKITPKNLSYDSTLPPFLARLQANQAASDGRHTYAVARPQKKRSAEDEADDEPVYFNEASGETLSKSEWEERERDVEADGKFEEKESGEVGTGGDDVEGEAEMQVRREKEKVAAIGAGKKRKAGRVVGGDDDVDAKESAERKDREATTLGKAIAASSAVASSKTEAKIKTEKSTKPTNKKSKKIKLSFDD